MAQFNDAWVEHQSRRWMQPDANRWMRPDAHRWMRPEVYRSLLSDRRDGGGTWSFDRKRGLARSVVHADDPDLDWRTVTTIRRAQCEIAAACVELALKQLKEAWRKANYNPSQPRVPAGQPGGGQWTGEGGGATRTPLAGSPPGIGHNAGPPLDEPPAIPQTKPVTAQEKNAFLKAAAQWLARNARFGVVGAFIAAYEALSWLDTDRTFIEAYQDAPNTLEELQQAVSEPKRGYDTHHVVEQTSAWDAEFPEELIDASANKVRIPTLKHWEINAWYQTKNKNYGGVSPRQYLQDKDWSERVRVGLEALIKVGVLKP